MRANFSVIDGHNENHHASEAKRIEVDFTIDWLKEKINYLNNFEQKARLAKQRAGPEIDYSKYFSDLEDEFKNE